MNSEMLALRKPSPEDRFLVLEAVPVPVPAAGQVRIRVTSAGLCGTDLHILDGDYGSRPPVTLGHEVAGVIDALGAGVDEAWLGALVAPETAFATCQSCAWCRDGRPMLCAERLSIGSGVDGGFAHSMLAPARALHRLPVWLDDHAAALMEPLACVCNAVLDPSRIGPGDRVVVSGAGPVGLLAAQVARSAGGTVTVVGTRGDDGRFEVARAMGFKTMSIDDPADRHSLDELGAGRAIDIVIECAGVGPAVAAALGWLRPRGRLVQMGLLGREIEVPFGRIVMGELFVSAGIGSTPASWRRAVSLVESRLVDLDPLVSAVLPLQAHAEALDRQLRREGLKTVFDPRLT